MKRRTPNAERRTDCGAAALFLAGLAIVLVPVAARNSYVGGGFYVTTSQFGPNFYIGNNPAADGTYQSLRFGRGAPEYERQDATELAERALGKRLTPAEVSRLLDRQGARLRHVEARRVAGADGPEGRAALERDRDGRHREPGSARGMVAAAARSAVSSDTSASSCPLALFGRLRHVADAIAALDSLRDDAGLRRERRRLLRVRTLPLPAGPAADAVRGWRVVAMPRADRRSAAAARRRLGARRGRRRRPSFCNWPMLSPALMRAVTETNLGSALQADGTARRGASTTTTARSRFAPEFPPAYNNLATALRAKGQIAEAIADLSAGACACVPSIPRRSTTSPTRCCDAGKAGRSDRALPRSRCRRSRRRSTSTTTSGSR